MVAPRKTHKKSRNGCNTCRQRRVKCDEKGPPCTRCVMRGIDCEFSSRSASRQSSTLPRAGSPAQAANSTALTQSLEQHPSEGQASIVSMRLLELELLHFYSTRTYEGLALLSPDQTLWQVFAVEEALKFDFLMKEIFALAALHKAIEIPKSATQYINHALEYQNEALALFRDTLQNVSQESSVAVIIFSIMTMIFAIVPREPVPGIHSKSPLENILAIFEFQKGTDSLVDICKHWLRSGPFRWIFGSRSPNHPVDVDDAFNAALTRLKELNSDYTISNTSNPAIFSDAISSLSFCYIGSKGRILAWLAMAGQDFMTKVKEHEPMALLILLHWAVLLDTLSELWWARNAGKRLVEEVAAVLEKAVLSSVSGCRPMWAEAVEWARWEARVGDGGKGSMVVWGGGG